jgi:hypothetical protein
LLDFWVTETGPSAANSSAFLGSEICVRFLAAIWPFPTTDSMGPFPTPKRLFPYGHPGGHSGDHPVYPALEDSSSRDPFESGFQASSSCSASQTTLVVPFGCLQEKATPERRAQPCIESLFRALDGLGPLWALLPEPLPRSARSGASLVPG